MQNRPNWQDAMVPQIWEQRKPNQANYIILVVHLLGAYFHLPYSQECPPVFAVFCASDPLASWVSSDTSAVANWKWYPITQNILVSSVENPWLAEGSQIDEQST